MRATNFSPAAVRHTYLSDLGLPGSFSFSWVLAYLSSLRSSLPPSIAYLHSSFFEIRRS